MSDLENLATHTHRSYVHHLREMVNKEKKKENYPILLLRILAIPFTNSSTTSTRHGVE